MLMAYCIQSHVFHLQHVFKLEQEEYLREGIEWKMIDFYDNQVPVTRALVRAPQMSITLKELHLKSFKIYKFNKIVDQRV